MTVVVENGRITDIAPASRGVSESRSGYTTRSVDARGRYLIPGLWDMHAHLDDVETLPLNAPDSAKALQLPLFVLQGVTGVRDMGGRLEVLSRWRDSIAAGQLVGPRIVACGPLLDGAPPFWPGSIGIRDAAAGRRAVDSLQRAGAAFIKVYSFLTRDAYFGIADEARRAGIPFDGHVPDSVTVVEASDAGQRTQEHLLRMLHATGDADSAKRALEATHARGGLQRYLVETTALLDTYDSTRSCRSVRALRRESHVAVANLDQYVSRGVRGG
jgi:imidazolonepropionase-like amidohydrolase